MKYYKSKREKTGFEGLTPTELWKKWEEICAVINPKGNCAKKLEHEALGGDARTWNEQNC